MLVSQVFFQLREEVRFRDSELSGIEVLTPAMTVLTLMQQPRGLSSGLLGGSEALQAKVGAAIGGFDAALAGESGRGFALVADEVRKLAERASKAMREITTMVSAIHEGTAKAVHTMRQGVARVHEGVKLGSRAGTTMHEIDDSAHSVVQSANDISNALREQSTGSNEIARSVERIARMAEEAEEAEENSVAARETASTAEGLERLARELQGQVARFKVA